MGRSCCILGSQISSCMMKSISSAKLVSLMLNSRRRASGFARRRLALARPLIKSDDNTAMIDVCGLMNVMGRMAVIMGTECANHEVRDVHAQCEAEFSPGDETCIECEPALAVHILVFASCSSFVPWFSSAFCRSMGCITLLV